MTRGVRRSISVPRKRQPPGGAAPTGRGQAQERAVPTRHPEPRSPDGLARPGRASHDPEAPLSVRARWMGRVASIAFVTFMCGIGLGCDDDQSAGSSGRGVGEVSAPAGPGVPGPGNNGRQSVAPADPLARPVPPVGRARRGSVPPSSATSGTGGNQAEVAQPGEIAPGITAETAPGTGAGNGAADLGGRLREAIGDPSPCLGNAASANQVVHLTVRAMVSTSGRVTRADVGGTGAPAAALECVRRRTLAAQLRGPVDGAPRPVDTTIELRARPARPPTP